MGTLTMTNFHISEPPKSPSPCPTIGDVLSRIAADEALAESRRKSVACSFRCISRLLDLDVASLPLEVAPLREVLQKFNPFKAGLRKSRWHNIKSDINFLLRYAGVEIVPGRSRTKLTPEWLAILEHLPNRRDRYSLTRFARNCIDRGILPDAVDDAVAAGYRRALKEQSLAKEPERSFRQAIKAWNRAVGAVEGWPGTTLSLPNNRSWWTSPLSRYPSSFYEEVEAWLRWLAGDNPFGDGAPVRPLKPSTIAGLRYEIRYAAAALVAEGWDPTSIASLHDLVEPESYETILRHLYDRHGGGDTKSTYKVSVTLKTMAKNRLKLGPDQLKPLDELCRRLAPDQTGMTEKNRERLRPFDDEQNVLRYLNFPRDQLRDVRRQDRGDRRDACKVQFALAVELLIVTLLRIGNLAGIHIDLNLSWTRGARKGLLHLVIAAEETKNGEPLEFELPGETAELLNIYLSDYRPRLTAGSNRWLFPGQGDGHKVKSVLASQIKQALLEATGLEVNAHLHRHLGAKLYLDSCPGGYEVVRRVLGHRSMETTVRAYTGMETAAATRHFDEKILQRRNRSPIPRKVSRR